MLHGHLRKSHESSRLPKAPPPARLGVGQRGQPLQPLEAVDPVVVAVRPVDLDGVAGYGTSFLEESFGGLIRENKVPLDVIKRTIKLISHEEPSLLDEINEYLEDAHKELKP